MKSSSNVVFILRDKISYGDFMSTNECVSNRYSYPSFSTGYSKLTWTCLYSFDILLLAVEMHG